MARRVVRICDYERKPPQWAYPRDHAAEIIILPIVFIERNPDRPIRRANHKMLPPVFFKPSK